MRIAVIGNGPSSRQHEVVWNQANRVVRCNIYGTGRCDIWASYFEKPVIEAAQRLGQDMSGPEMFWQTMTPTTDRALIPWEDTTASAHRVANGRPVRQFSDSEYIELSAEIGERRPSTGLIAVRMALDLCPRELILAGFDALRPGLPGWNDELVPWKENPPYHDFQAEKASLERLVAGKAFCGFHWRTKIVWLRMT